MKRKSMILAILVTTFGISIAAAQVKLAEIAGAPGKFDFSTMVAYHALPTPDSCRIPALGWSRNSALRRANPRLGRASRGCRPAGCRRRRLNLVVANVINRGSTSSVLTHESSAGNGLSQFFFYGRCNVIIGRDNTNFFIADPKRDGVATFVMWNGLFDRMIPVGSIRQRWSAIPV